MKIVIDAFGGDNAPHEIIRGAILSLKKYEDLTIVLCGYENKIKDCLKAYEYDKDRIIVVNANSVIDNDDVPTVAIKEKIDSSLVVAFDYLKVNKDVIALISAGNTGAILTGGFLKVGRIKGVSRPALCPFLPTKTGGYFLLLDAGANMDSRPVNLCHFAAMGSAYFSLIHGKENPRVGLLNVGSEDHKGNELCKQTFPLLKEMKNINFVGNVEARDIMNGEYDVIVTDGFNGNVALKSIEGALKMLLGEIKGAAKKNIITKIGALFMSGGFKGIKKKFNFDVYSGSPFLGCKKTIIKAHGSSKAPAIIASIDTAVGLHQKNFNNIIEEMLKEIDITE